MIVPAHGRRDRTALLLALEEAACASDRTRIVAAARALNAA